MQFASVATLNIDREALAQITAANKKKNKMGKFKVVQSPGSHELQAFDYDHHKIEQSSTPNSIEAAGAEPTSKLATNKVGMSPMKSALVE